MSITVIGDLEATLANHFFQLRVVAPSTDMDCALYLYQSLRYLC